MRKFWVIFFLYPFLCFSDSSITPDYVSDPGGWSTGPIVGGSTEPFKGGVCGCACPEGTAPTYMLHPIQSSDSAPIEECGLNCGEKCDCVPTNKVTFLVVAQFDSKEVLKDAGQCLYFRSPPPPGSPYIEGLE